MAHEERRKAEVPDDRFQVGKDLRLAREVEAGQGLVEQEQLGAREERPPEGHALALAAGETVHAPGEQARQIEARHDVGAREARVPAPAPTGREVEVPRDVEMVEEAGLLEQEADRPLMGRDEDAGIDVREDPLAERDPPPDGSLEPGDRAQQRRLPASARTEERRHAPRLEPLVDLEGEVGEVDPHAQVEPRPSFFHSAPHRAVALSRHGRGPCDRRRRRGGGR